MDGKTFQFSVKNVLEGKSIHSEIDKLEDCSFQKGILLAWKGFLPVPDFQGGTSFVDILCFLSCVCYAFVRVCLFVPCGNLLGKG